MQRLLAHADARRSTFLGAVLIMAVSSLLTVQANAHLITRFGISRSLAFAIISVIDSGGITLALAIYPFLAPIIGTLEFIIFIGGATGAATF